jgi:CARDB
MKMRLIGLFAIAFVLTASAITAPAQFDNFPKLPQKKPQPGALPDLTVDSALFRNTTADVVIKNVGKAPSKSTPVILKFHETLDQTSKVPWTFSMNVPPLAAGKEVTIHFETATKTMTFIGHGRTIEIDPYNTLNESNKRNNKLFSNDAPAADVGTFPEPAYPPFDLTLTKVKFISPAKVEFCVKNVGSVASGSYDVRATVYKGAKKESGVYMSTSMTFNSLNANAQQCFNYTLADGSDEIFLNRSRFVEILPKQSELNVSNNSYFETALQPPWSPTPAPE